MFLFGSAFFGNMDFGHLQVFIFIYKHRSPLHVFNYVNELTFHADVFKTFKGEDGTFNHDITKDPKGLLCFYNAAYVLTHGEPLLEEAISFTKYHLESLAPSLVSPLAEQVKRALHVPLPRTYRRLEALQYMPEYEKEVGYNPTLLELAKLEFNLLQSVHLKELKAISENVSSDTHSSIFFDISHY